VVCAGTAPIIESDDELAELINELYTSDGRPNRLTLHRLRTCPCR
jgi:hypothetical protein